MAMDTFDTPDLGGGYLSTDPMAGAPVAHASGVGGTGGIMPPQGGGAAYGGDPANVDSWLSWMAQQPGHDPYLDSPEGINYYKTQINSKPDKLNANNLDYWKNKATLAAYGGGVGAPEGGGMGGFGGLMNHAPSLSDLQNMPGFQFALNNGQNMLQHSAAAKGTLLTGGTLKDLSDYTTNMSLNQAFFPYWNAQNSSNNSNAGNLYNLASLGLNASSVGAQ